MPDPITSEDFNIHLRSIPSVSVYLQQIASHLKGMMRISIKTLLFSLLI